MHTETLAIVVLTALVLASLWSNHHMSQALDNLNSAVDQLIAKADAPPAPTDGATAAELDAVTAKIDNALNPPQTVESGFTA